MLAVLNVLTEQVTAHLKSNNADFLKMCSPAEKYSVSEVKFFTGEMQLLDEGVDKLAANRREQLEEIKAQATPLAEEPLHEFAKQHAEAVENLCKRDGLGRKYGAPRRAAQEQVRSVIARAQNASHALSVFFGNYFRNLAIGGSDGPSEQDLLCRGSLRRTHLHPMSCAMELRASYTIVVSAARTICQHVGALTSPFDAELSQPAIVPCFSQEGSMALVAPEEGGDPVEIAVVNNAVDLILGTVVEAEQFQDTVKFVREQATKHFNNNLPHFMVSALASMEASATKNRQDICRKLRTMCDELRGAAAIAAVKQTFNDLENRSLEYLLTRLANREKEFRDKLRASMALRNQHEKELRPSLANPQCAHLLADLRRERSSTSRGTPSRHRVRAQGFQKHSCA